MSTQPASPNDLPAVPEPARALPCTGHYDVLIAGGGIAGVAAALAAARMGASVCLLEKQSALGGLATLGNVIVWLPLCDGRGRQVIGGLGEELLRLSVRDLVRDDPAASFRRVPPCWESEGDAEERKRTRFLTLFNPSEYLFALEALVTDAGVRLLYDTRVCSVVRDGQRITHVIVENKSGRSAIAARTVIDATGDADVCFLTGEPTESLDSNVLTGWFYTLEDGQVRLHQHTHPYCPRATREGGKGPFFRGDDAQQVTEHLLQTRATIRTKLAALRARDPQRDVQLFNPATIACFRMTRRLIGRFTLGEGHMHQWRDDTVGLTGDWRTPGPVYPLPLGSLLADGTRNLLAAGRCISADTSVWDVTRAIPACVVTGQAAGTAAALAVRTAGAGAPTDLHALPVPALQAQLRTQGVLLHPDLLRRLE